MIRRQYFKGTIQHSAFFQGLHQPLVNRQECRRLRPGVSEHLILQIVVEEHMIRNVISHRAQQLVALLHREVAVGYHCV